MMESVEMIETIEADLWCEFYIVILTRVICHLQRLQNLNYFKFGMVTTMTTQLTSITMHRNGLTSLLENFTRKFV